MNLEEMTENELAALAREVANPNGPVAIAIALLEHAADLFREKGKARTADGYIQTAEDLRQKINLPRPSVIGVDRLAQSQRGAAPADRGQDLQQAVERLARQVVERELAPGGLIQRYIAQEVRHG